MANITRKLRTQQRYTDIAKGPINAFTAGHVTGLSLGEGERAVSFTVRGVATAAKYEFKVAMTEQEWNHLKNTLDGMLAGQKTTDEEDDD